MNRKYSLATLLLLTASAGLAVGAQDSKKSSDADLLRGPDVTESGTTTNSDSSEKDAMTMEEEIDDRPIVMRELSVAFRNLQRAGGSSSLKLDLTQEQKDGIREITMQFREDMKAFQEANAEKLEKLRDDMNAESWKIRESAKEREQERREMREAGEDAKDASDEKPRRPETPAADKLRDFVEKSPANENARRRFKELLGEENWAVVTDYVMNQRGRIADRRENGPRQGRRGGGMDAERVSPAERRERSRERGTSTSDD